MEKEKPENIHSQAYKDRMPWHVIEWADDKVQVFVDDGFDEIFVSEQPSLEDAEVFVEAHNAGLKAF